MKHLLALILLAACAVIAHGQTIKSLGYNTTNSTVIGPTSGVLLFTNGANFPTVSANSVEVGSELFVGDAATLVFDGEGAENWRSSLGLGATWLTNTNVTNFCTAIGLGATNSVEFGSLDATNITSSGEMNALFLSVEAGGSISFDDAFAAAATRTDLNLSATWLTNTNAADFRTAIGLGETNQATFQEVYADTIVATTAINNSGNFTNNGDITINQTATNNGLLYIRRTNNEAFLGLANLIASNNVTVSNETLFRVGVSEATNKAAQFGFRSTNTNGNGVAVFSVFGFNALMMVGADASTNAVIYSGGGTNNEVMTLIKSGATEFARPISFSTTAHAAATRTNLALGAASDPTFRDVSVRDLSIVGGSGGKIVYPATNTAPADTTNVVTWIQVNVGTNSYRVPLYQ